MLRLNHRCTACLLYNSLTNRRKNLMARNSYVMLRNCSVMFWCNKFPKLVQWSFQTDLYGA